jgi:hypothetical protein
LVNSLKESVGAEEVHQNATIYNQKAINSSDPLQSGQNTPIFRFKRLKRLYLFV